MDKFKFLEHTADIKFQAFGDSLEECFANAGLALREVFYKGSVEAVEKKVVKVKGRDRESLLYEFLEEFLYLIDVGGFLVGKIENVKISGVPKLKEGKKIYDWVLTADVLGDALENYDIEGEVKAITYNDMFVRQDRGRGKARFVCQVVVDV